MLPVPDANLTCLLGMATFICIPCAPVLLVALFLTDAVGARAGWKIVRPLKKPLMVLGALLLAAWTMAIALEVWPDLPFAQEEAIRVADEFMLDLHNGDALAAGRKLTPEAQAAAGIDGFSVNDAYRPVDWQLTGYEHYAIVGTATFPDGQELPVEVNIQWRFTGWYIHGVLFGEPSNPKYRWLISE